MPSEAHGHGHGHHGPPDTSRGFEQSDISLKGLTTGVIVYFIFTGAVGLVVLLGMWLFHVNSAPPVGTNIEVGRRLPPAPNPMLQNNITARTDIWNLRAREDFLLNNITWVDQSKGTVRIPIDQALDRAAQLGPAALTTSQSRPQASTVAPVPANVPQTQAGRAVVAPNSLIGRSGQAPSAIINTNKPNVVVNPNHVAPPVRGGLPKK